MNKFLVAIIFGVMIVAQVAVAAQSNYNYQAYVEDVGWLKSVTNGETAGTTGRALRMEAVRINFAGGGVQYCAHVQNYGWMSWKNSGEVAGTTGQNLRMEAIRIRLSGNYVDRFDIYYRAHVENGGWLGWAKNGEPAGTAGAGLRMEALQIRLVPKGFYIERGGNAFYQKGGGLDVI